MAFNNFPYTDMHELNLDWLIKTVKDYVSAFYDLKGETEAELATMDDKIDAIRYQVEHFIDTLDLPTEVRDAIREMKDSGELDQIILQALGGQVKMYVCGQKETDTHSGVIFYNQQGHCVVHDFGYDKPLVKNFVVSNNLTVDAIIISHYHSDHIGQNGGLLLIDFLNSATLADDCKAYLPHHLLNWSSVTFNSNVMQGNETAVINALTNAGVTIVYPTEGQTVTHAGWSFRFLNLRQDVFESMATGNQYTIYGEHQDYATYNNYSMMVFAQAYGKCVLLPGDIEYRAAEFNMYYTRLADVYFIEHHSNNIVMPTTYLSGLNPKYAIVQNNVETWPNLWYLRATASHLVAGGCYPINTYGMGWCELTFTMGGIVAYTQTNDYDRHNIAMIDCNTYGNGILAGDTLNALVEPGTYNCYSYADYNLVGTPAFIANRGAGYVKNRLGRAGTQDIIQDVETAGAPFASFSRYRAGGVWSDYYASIKSPYVCERVARTSTRWKVTPSETNYGAGNTMLSCVNGTLIFAAVCQFDEDITGAAEFFNTGLPVSNFLSQRPYGTGYAIPFTGGTPMPLRCGGVDGTIQIWSNATIPANTTLVMSLTTPYFG